MARRVAIPPLRQNKFQEGLLEGIEVGNFAQVNPDPTLIHQGIVRDEDQLSASVARNESGGLIWTAAFQTYELLIDRQSLHFH